MAKHNNGTSPVVGWTIVGFCGIIAAVFIFTIVSTLQTFGTDNTRSLRGDALVEAEASQDFPVPQTAYVRDCKTGEISTLTLVFAISRVSSSTSCSGSLATIESANGPVTVDGDIVVSPLPLSESDLAEKFG